MKISIHQPNFFPWLGFFDKINRSDFFIILDDVQIPKTGSSWINRVKLLIAGDAKWVTAPVNRNYSDTIKINEAFFQPNNNWRQKMINTIQINYKKAKYFSSVYPFFESLILNTEENIALYNSHVIKQIASHLDISGEKILYSSHINHTGTSNDLLISLVQSINGKVYICGGGADGYQEPAMFEAAGIQLEYQQFKHPVYTQVGTDNFFPGLSTIDAVMNHGWLEVKKLLTQYN